MAQRCAAKGSPAAHTGGGRWEGLKPRGKKPPRGFIVPVAVFCGRGLCPARAAAHPCTGAPPLCSSVPLACLPLPPFLCPAAQGLLLPPEKRLGNVPVRMCRRTAQRPGKQERKQRHCNNCHPDTSPPPSAILRRPVRAKRREPPRATPAAPFLPFCAPPHIFMRGRPRCAEKTPPRKKTPLTGNPSGADWGAWGLLPAARGVAFRPCGSAPSGG